MSVRIYPYNSHSRSVKLLGSSLNVRQIRREGSTYEESEGDIIINWGCGRNPTWFSGDAEWLNLPRQVHIAVNKLRFFETLRDAGYPHILDFTKSKEEALAWLSGGSVVYCRTRLTGREGDGIVVAHSAEEVVDAPLYTKGEGKSREYRVHIMKGKVIHLSQKKRRKDVPDATSEVKNWKNGWVFTHHDITPLGEGMEEECIKAIELLGLDFGALDILTQKGEVLKVIEVNTAPGIMGETEEAYTTAFRDVCFPAVRARAPRPGDDIWAISEDAEMPTWSGGTSRFETVPLAPSTNWITYPPRTSAQVEVDTETRRTRTGRAVHSHNNLDFVIIDDLEDIN